LKRPFESLQFGFTFWVVCLKRDQHPDAPHALGSWALCLLCARGERIGRRAAEQSDELAPSYIEHRDFLPALGLP